MATFYPKQRPTSFPGQGPTLAVLSPGPVGRRLRDHKWGWKAEEGQFFLCGLRHTPKKEKSSGGEARGKAAKQKSGSLNYSVDGLHHLQDNVRCLSAHTFKKDRQADSSSAKIPEWTLVTDNHDYPCRRQHGQTARSCPARAAGIQPAPQGLGLTSSQALLTCSLGGEYFQRVSGQRRSQLLKRVR